MKCRSLLIGQDDQGHVLMVKAVMGCPSRRRVCIVSSVVFTAVLVYPVLFFFRQFIVILLLVLYFI